jgi:hypothetical protein
MGPEPRIATLAHATHAPFPVQGEASQGIASR